MTKVTFITDSDETHTVESEQINVVFHSASITINFQRGEVFPDEIRGMSPSTVKQWDIVVTYDGETKSGQITSADGLTVEFNPLY